MFRNDVAVVAGLAPDVVLPSPPPTIRITTVLRHAVSAAMSLVASVLASSSINFTGVSGLFASSLPAGKRPPEVRVSLLNVVSIVVAAFAASVCTRRPDVPEVPFQFDTVGREIFHLPLLLPSPINCPE